MVNVVIGQVEFTTQNLICKSKCGCFTNIEPFNKFLEVLNKPYLEQRDIINYQMPIYSNEKYPELLHYCTH